MNVAIITYVYPPEHAPGGIMVQELAEDLAARGHRVTVLTGWPSHPRGAIFPGWRGALREVRREGRRLTVIRCGHSFGPRRRIFWRLHHHFTFALTSFWNGLSAGPFDVLVCASTPIFGCWTARLLAALRGAAFVYDISDLRPESLRSAGMLGDGLVYRAMLADDTQLCRWSDAITTLSTNLQRAICARGIEPEKVHVIPFWLDPAKVQPLPRDNPWRREHGIPLDTFVALYAGTIGFVSGAEMLVEVARRLRRRDDILLLMVGEGPVKDKLVSLARAEGLTNLAFLPFQPAQDLSAMQAAADVGLITLLPEAGENSVPSKMLGYLAAGRAVLASVRADSPTAAAIEEGRCGRVVPPQDPAALAEAIEAAAADPDWVRLAGRNAREHFLRSYSRPHATARWEELLRRLAEGRYNGRRDGTGPERMSFWKRTTDPGDATARPSPRLWRLKYAVEWVLALALTVALLPLGLLLALLVKVTSRGPVFYVAERLGRNDRPFRLLKFRSMKVGAPEVRAASGKIITVPGDSRLTSIGPFLRLGFDELPQLLNVLKGDMCLIGPRPDVVWQRDLYWPRERLRTFALPGITGLTQVMGGRELDNHQNYELDVRYVVRSNAWMDLWIALLTPAYALGAKKIGQRFFRRHMEGMEAFSDAAVAAAREASTPV